MNEPVVKAVQLLGPGKPLVRISSQASRSSLGLRCPAPSAIYGLMLASLTLLLGEFFSVCVCGGLQIVLLLANINKYPVLWREGKV